MRRSVPVLVVVVIYLIARPAGTSPSERASLARSFEFSGSFLPRPPSKERRTMRDVHPSLEKIRPWISAVGASAAFGDLDGDGLPNDVCFVETSTDRVIVTGIPQTTPRYPVFTLSAQRRSASEKSAPMGCLIADLNMDGLEDALVYYWGRTPVAFLRRGHVSAAVGSVRETPEAASFVAREIIPTAERWYTNAATLADLDGDGFADIVLGNYFADGARILDSTAEGREFMQDSMSTARNGGRNRVLRWLHGSSGAEPNVEYADDSHSLDEFNARAWTLAIAAADIDGDARPELYFANDFGPDVLLHNRSEAGNIRFRAVLGQRGIQHPKSKVLGFDSFKGMGADFGDINGDGVLDLYVSNIATDFALHESHFLFTSVGDASEKMARGIAPYVDQSEPLGLSRSGWGWESKLADFDNDGVSEAIQATGFVKGKQDRWAELHEIAMANDVATRFTDFWPWFRSGDDISGHQATAFFVRSSSGRFVDVGNEVGFEGTPVTRGIALADADGDGDLDLVLANQWETSFYYRNDCDPCGSFLGLDLVFPVPPEDHGDHVRTHKGLSPNGIPTRAALGATVRLERPGLPDLVGFVDGGNGHSGARSPQVLFGLGDRPEADYALSLRWRQHDELHERTLRLEPGWHTVTLAAR